MDNIKKRKRVRFKLKNSNLSNRPRLSVYRTEGNVYLQIIDGGKTLVSLNTLNKEYKDNCENSKAYNVSGAYKLGFLMGKKALFNNIKEVYFDRGEYLYHGRIKAVADGVRAAGVVI
jgi:large subunit ribosomal protein L18